MAAVIMAAVRLAFLSQAAAATGLIHHTIVGNTSPPPTGSGCVLKSTAQQLVLLDLGGKDGTD
jgi:hypothetical protein